MKVTVKSKFAGFHSEDVLAAMACELKEDTRGCAACPYRIHRDCMERWVLDARDIIEDWQEKRDAEKPVIPGT